MSNKVAILFKNFFTTTAITILLISAVGIITGDSTVYIAVIWQSVLINAVIHLGIIGIRKLQITYFLVESVLNIVFGIGVVLLVGNICGWFVTSPMWITLLLTICVFATAFLFNIITVKRDIEEINEKIKLRKADLEQILK